MSETDKATVKSDTSTSFGPVKQVDAGPLTVGYAEAGRAGFGIADSPRARIDLLDRPT